MITPATPIELRKGLALGALLFAVSMAGLATTGQASDLRLQLEQIAGEALTDQELPGISIAMRLPDGRVLTGFVLDEEPLFAPSEGYAYTDPGYLLVGMIIEAATGSEWTGGGLFNTASMLVRFYSALAEGEVVSQAAYATMRDAGFGPADNHYGYGLYIRHHPELGPTSGHGGWYPGYSTAVAYLPEHRIAVAVQTNTDGDGVDLYEPLVEAATHWVTHQSGAPIQPE